MNINIVMWGVVRFFLICIFSNMYFLYFYKYKTRDIRPQSSALVCVKSVRITVICKRREYMLMNRSRAKTLMLTLGVMFCT